jgi:hypothetical protein
MSELAIALDRLINTVCDVLEKEFLSNGHGPTSKEIQSATKHIVRPPYATESTVQANPPDWVMPETAAQKKAAAAAAAKAAKEAKPEPVAPPLQQSFDPMAEMLGESDATTQALTIEEVKAEIDRCYSLKKDEVSQKAFGADFMAAIKKFGAKSLKEVPAAKYADLLSIVASL